ncbi:uncharacterized protein DUF4381 [Alteromonadaceae bacterium 2753L.S.0a.02]|nr:uncharacterized protein DUF4381 [Alteromonadaceae bacterium 2753L.S.0a.02]
MNPVVQSQPAAASPVEQLLAQMQGPALPDPIGYWPPAPGWWVLGILVITAIGLTVYSILRKRARNRYRTTALRALDDIARGVPENKAYRLKALLKQTFFTAYPRERNRVAALHGQHWLQELHSSGKLHKLPFKQQELFARYFSEEIYQLNSNLHEPASLHIFIEVCRYWIKKHTTKPAPVYPVTAAAHALATGGTD